MDSHVLPKALYRYLRASGGSDPVSVTKDRVHQSSKQVTAYLLCSACEKLLNENGERWMLHQGFRGQHRFRLREALLRATPLGPVHDGIAYSASNITELDVARIAYYASSVFWRASLPSSSNDREYQISLGKGYEAAFREYLLGCACFPSSAALVVQVANTNSPLQAFCFPFSQRHDGYHHHSFFAQGVLFWLFVGGRLPAKLDYICIVRSKAQVIFLSDKLEESVQSGSIDLLADAMRKRKT
jgi:hypothetical protein